MKVPCDGRCPKCLEPCTMGPHYDSLRTFLRKSDQAAREFSLGFAKDRAAAEELENFMSELSEECFCAGWMHGLEFALWSGVELPEGQTLDYGMGGVDPESLTRLRQLASKAGGWWLWQRDLTCLFVPTERWAQVYAEAR